MSSKPDLVWMGVTLQPYKMYGVYVAQDGRRAFTVHREDGMQLPRLPAPMSAMTLDNLVMVLEWEMELKIRGL